jgi:hypothetical protein
MKRNEFIFSLLLGLLLGAGVIVLLSANGSFPILIFAEEQPTYESPRRTNQPSPPITSTSEPEIPLTGDMVEGDEPTLIPFPDLSPIGEDLEDVLLLYSGSDVTKFDQTFCDIASYYGLICKRVDIELVPITRDIFYDNQGEVFKLIGIHAKYLNLNRYLISTSERFVIKDLISTQGAHLLVSNLDEKNFPAGLVSLTFGAIQGVQDPVDSSKDWIISTYSPEITKELTGHTFTADSDREPRDFAILFQDLSSVTPLISSQDDFGTEYSLFVKVDVGNGIIFVDASDEIPDWEDLTLRDLYYSQEWFSRIIPLMVTFRYSVNEEGWHVNKNYANLTIDSLRLVQDFQGMDYDQLIREMRADNFHTTIGLIPATWEKSESYVASIVRSNPDYYSVVQNGNNHDGYEFYRVEISPRDYLAGDPKPARSVMEQEADIVEGLSRLDHHWARTGIEYDRVMVFPYDSFPEASLILLKRNNYLGAVSTRANPIDVEESYSWTSQMFPANLDFANFPLLRQRDIGDSTIQQIISPFLLDMFVDKPALINMSVNEFAEMDQIISCY